MKVLIVFTSLLAITLAGGHQQQQQHYSINIPVIGKTGVPLESADIVHARLAHLSHVAAVKTRPGQDIMDKYDGHSGYAGNGGWSGNTGNSGISGWSDNSGNAEISGWSGNSGNAGVSGWSGNSGNAGYSGGYNTNPEAHTYPNFGHNGQPIETPAVQALKQKHLAAHSNALSRLGKGNNAWASAENSNGVYSTGNLGGHSGGYNNPEAHTYPAIGHDGQPIETPAVQALKSKHFAAHSEALSRIASEQSAWEDDGSYKGQQNGGNAWENDEVTSYNNQQSGNNAWQNEGVGSYNNQQNAHNAWSNEGATSYSNQQLGAHGASGYGQSKYQGQIHIPVIGHTGVPADTPEVQHARQQHYAALAEASSKKW